jgi:hypothetical protein
MNNLPVSQKHLAHFLALMGKVILLSWPIGALLLALNPFFVAVENVLTSKMAMARGILLTGDCHKALGGFSLA